MIEELKKAGVDVIKISIDNPVPEEHDKIRDKGTFQQVVKALEYIHKTKGIIGQISTTCAKEILNSSRIWELLKLARKSTMLYWD